MLGGQRRGRIRRCCFCRLRAAEDHQCHMLRRRRNFSFSHFSSPSVGRPSLIAFHFIPLSGNQQTKPGDRERYRTRGKYLECFGFFSWGTSTTEGIVKDSLSLPLDWWSGRRLQLWSLLARRSLCVRRRHGQRDDSGGRVCRHLFLLFTQSFCEKMMLQLSILSCDAGVSLSKMFFTP